jgi:hypothetical protein
MKCFKIKFEVWNGGVEMDRPVLNIPNAIFRFALTLVPGMTDFYNIVNIPKGIAK